MLTYAAPSWPTPTKNVATVALPKRICMSKDRCCDDSNTAAGACISADGSLRYRLWRKWDAGKSLGFIMLNPSVATADVNDHTIRKCIGFARCNGYTGIDVVNLFALVSTDPTALLRYDGTKHESKNMQHIMSVIAERDTVLAFGDLRPEIRERGPVLRSLLNAVGGRRVYCIGTTQRGYPRHPSRPGYTMPIVPFDIKALPH